MVPRLRGQDLLFGGAETLDFAPSSNKISDYWGGSCPPRPPHNYLPDLLILMQKMERKVKKKISKKRKLIN